MAIDDGGAAPGKFDYQPGDVILTQCASCVWLVSGRFANVCPAFPGAIPGEILSNDFDHRRPHPDEVVPVRFVARGDVPQATLQSLYRALDSLPH